MVTLKFLFGPDGENVANAVVEMESAATGEFEGGYDDTSTCRYNRVFGRFQIRRIENDQRSEAWLGLR